jgi:hypothetical protein
MFFSWFMVLYETQASFYMIHNSHLVSKPLKLESCFHFCWSCLVAFATFNFQVPICCAAQTQQHSRVTTSTHIYIDHWSGSRTRGCEICGGMRPEAQSLCFCPLLSAEVSLTSGPACNNVPSQAVKEDQIKNWNGKKKVNEAQHCSSS